MTAKDDAADERRIQAIAAHQPPFAKLMGVKIIEVSRDRVVAEIVVREELTNRNGGLHGGAVMGIADNIGGTATFVNMPPGRRHHHDREQDQFLRRGAGRRHHPGGMHAAAPRAHHHGLADPDHPQRRPARGDRHPDPAHHRAAGVERF